MVKTIPVRSEPLIPAYMSADGSHLIHEENELKKGKSKNRQTEVANMYASITKENKVDSLGIWTQAPRINPFNLNVQEALQPFNILQPNTNVTMFDIEAFGTPKHQRVDKSMNIFSITELSFGTSRYRGNNGYGSLGQVTSLAIKPTIKQRDGMMEMIRALKTNKDLPISEDMKRSLTDLIKYSDARLIGSGGRLKGHARIPQAKSRFTSQSILEMERGLQNLFKHGAPLENAFELFERHINKHSSVIGGYNIHNYDVPAMMGVANGQFKQFLGKHKATALDYYAGYAATETDPFTFTGKSTKQESVHQSLIQKGLIPAPAIPLDYHFAKDDITATAQNASVLTNRIKSNISTGREHSDYKYNPSTLKTTEAFNIGDEIFSFKSGMHNPAKHKHNLVGTMVNDGKGTLTPRWGTLDSSLPANENFVISEFLKDVMHPVTKEKMYGARLESKAIQGKSVLLFSETPGQLAQQFHDSFMVATEGNVKERLARVQDNARREYGKMFDSGGSKKMSQFYNWLDSGSDITSEAGWIQHVLKNGGSEELAIKFPHMVPRLKAERGIWKSVTSSAGYQGLDDNQKDIALRNVYQDFSTGVENKKSTNVAGTKRFLFRMGQDEHLLDAKDPDSIKKLFRGYVKGYKGGERVGVAESSFQLNRIQQLEEIITQQFGLKGAEAAKVKELTKGMLATVGKGESIETALTSISNFVQKRITRKGVGTEDYVREISHAVTPQHGVYINKYMKQLPDVTTNAIQYAKTYTKKTAALTNDPMLTRFVESQDKRIKEVFHKNFMVGGMNEKKDVDRAAKMAAKYSELLQGIIDGYSHDFNTQIRFTKGGAPILMLADKKAGMDMFQAKTLEEIQRNPKIAHVQLPYLDKELMVGYGNSKKMPVMRSGIRLKSGLPDHFHSLSVTDALQALMESTSRVKQMATDAELLGKKDLMIQMTRTLRTKVGNQVNPVSGHYDRKLDSDGVKLFQADNALVSITRASRWDTTGYAEAWWRDNALKLGLVTPAKYTHELNRIHGRMDNEFISFHEAMGSKAQQASLVQGGILDYAQEKSSLVGSNFGVNKTAAGHGLSGTGRTDARRMQAMGHFYRDSVENSQKAVNYRPLDRGLAEKVFERAGKNFDYRFNHSFISSDANEALVAKNEVRGMQLATGYMNDAQLSLKLKNDETVKMYKDMIDKEPGLTKEQKTNMKKSIDSYMLSTNEGLAFTDYRLMEGFGGIEDVRIKIQHENANLHKIIESKIEIEAQKQGYAKGEWKTKGITFENPIQFTEQEYANLLDGKGVFSVGDYTINNVVTGQVEETKQFRKGDTVSILGYNADDTFERTLVLGRERKIGHGVKTVTEGGIRNTNVAMIQPVMEHMYGVKGIEKITNKLSASKGVPDLPALIRGYEMRIRQQFNGELKRTVEHSSVEQALESYYKDVDATFNVQTNRTEDGRYVVDSNFGIDREKIDQSGRTDFSGRWQAQLGINREVFADIEQKHNVYERHGGPNNGKITNKEIEQLSRNYKGAGLVLPGESNAHIDFWKEMVYGDSTTPEIKAQQRVFNEQINTFMNMSKKGWTPKAGDAVIDFTSEATAVKANSNSEIREDGILRISKDNFTNVMDPSHHKQVYTTQDYVRHVINARNFEFDTGQSKGTVDKFLKKNNGSAYMRIGEDQYVPLVDADLFNHPGTVAGNDKVHFNNNLQSHYVRIAQKTEELNSLFTTDQSSELHIKQVADKQIRLQQDLDREVAAMLDTISGAASSKGGFSNLMARRMPMSSQYQFGGVNPLMAYTKEDGKWVNKGPVKEGEIYMNSKDVRNLIGDKAENIAKSWGADTTKISKENMTDWVIENWNKNDTYSSDIRYPSIDAGTSQTLKLRINDAVGEGQVVGLPGMAERISGDFDGDAIAVFLSHYGIDDDKKRAAVLGNMSDVQQFETKKNLLQGSIIMKEQEQEFRHAMEVATVGQKISSGDMDQIVDNFFAQSHNQGLTVGKMHGQEAQEFIRNALDGRVDADIFMKTTAEERKVTNYALAVGNSIGQFDNARTRMSAAYQSRAETLYKRFHNAEGPLRYSLDNYIEDTTSVNEFLREFTQQPISSKKAQGSQASEQEMLQDLHDILKRVKNPHQEQDLDVLTSDLIDGFKMYKSPQLTEARGGVIPEDVHAFVKGNLVRLADAENAYSSVLSRGSGDSSLILAGSYGTGSNALRDIVQTGAHIPGSDQVELLRDAVRKNGSNVMDEHAEFLEDSISKDYIRQKMNATDRLEDAASTLDIMNGNGGSIPRVIANSDMEVHRTMNSAVKSNLSEIATNGRLAFSGGGAGMLGAAGLGMAAMWATTAIGKGTPTPEGMQDMAPVQMKTLGAPAARITPNESGEYINIKVKSSAAQSLNHQDIAAMVNNEVMAMAQMRMNTNVNVTNNSQTINGKWVEQAVANSVNKGYAYN